MDQYEMVRTAHRVYKKSIRQIARETGHTRRTVRKVLAGQEPKYRREHPRRAIGSTRAVRSTVSFSAADPREAPRAPSG